MSDPAPDLDALKRRWLAAIGISASTTGSYKQTQQSPVYLPQVFAGNEEGKRAMTKAELEAFIDHRWQSRCERLEREVESLKRRVNELESRRK